jgi:hypothetical protein|tara:strand:+ start:55075 stop:55446 length:372 start_codon:yes stop_codon:yes gene_type:complete
MNIRILVGVALAFLSAWLLWQGLSAVIMITSRGSPLGDALLQPPTSLVRIVAAGVVLLGGLVAVAQRPGGAWLAGLGTFLFALLPVMMAATGTASRLWADEAVVSLVLIALTAALYVIKRRKA